jgi:hypothetical protein
MTMKLASAITRIVATCVLSGAVTSLGGTAADAASKKSGRCDYAAEIGYDEKPIDFHAYLPKSGAVLISGGFMSTSRVAVLDLAAKKLSFATGGPKSRAQNCQTIRLSKKAGAKLINYVNAITTSGEQCLNKVPIADFNVEGELSLKGSETKFQCYGPPTGTYKLLYEFAWSLDPAKVS